MKQMHSVYFYLSSVFQIMLIKLLYTTTKGTYVEPTILLVEK